MQASHLHKYVLCTPYVSRYVLNSLSIHFDNNARCLWSQFAVRAPALARGWLPGVSHSEATPEPWNMCQVIEGATDKHSTFQHSVPSSIWCAINSLFRIMIVGDIACLLYSPTVQYSPSSGINTENPVASTEYSQPALSSCSKCFSAKIVPKASWVIWQSTLWAEAITDILQGASLAFV